eukprot:UN09847
MADVVIVLLGIQFDRAHRYLLTEDVQNEYYKAKKHAPGMKAAEIWCWTNFGKSSLILKLKIL